MPFIDIDIDDILYACSEYDIKNLIVSLVENGYLPKEVINEKNEVKQELTKTGWMQGEFCENLEKMKTKFYSLNFEEEKFLEEIFRKYL